jgi:hypothetical protein
MTAEKCLAGDPGGRWDAGGRGGLGDSPPKPPLPPRREWGSLAAFGGFRYGSTRTPFQKATRLAISAASGFGAG